MRFGPRGTERAAMNESDTELVRAGYEAFGRGDMDLVLQLL